MSFQTHFVALNGAASCMTTKKTKLAWQLLREQAQFDGSMELSAGPNRVILNVVPKIVPSI